MKESENVDNDNYQYIYASIARMSGDGQSSSRDLGDILQSTNWIWDSGATFHMTPQVSALIPGWLEDKDKCIEVADGNYVPGKQKGQVQIIM